MENEKISWEAPEYIFYRRSREWYLSLGIITAALFIVSILFKNYLFAVVILIGAFSMVLHTKRQPKDTYYEINRSGIILNKTFYPYSFLESFWIDHTDPNWKKLLIVSKKTFMPLIIIPFAEQDADEVEQFLGNYLVRKEYYEPLSHRIIEYLGF
ncbi:MAG: hypothetical protein A2664_01385 [Candidatus Taylorbacteria bacterium RIFCSPHIGHO2_01_FULL_46_22b]|uniref:DUF5673 domain-containing protein n=1 Tax=Candidatus Taylorbacteria bacterium RIFCSPHIGHO2_01_FULL_46_22b TaxID=1802301 RepID=A0A1G2M2D2_9BACT|nr:MAG: hypothetical protein A2664_01385 [Candidatus Taylorbacteria bacterium RIFCSPHIGHO2_01_FULL_46_22b]